MPVVIPTSTRAVEPEPSDAVLAARLRAGDLTALDALFRRHAPHLLRVAAGLTASPDDAEDVVQDVFVGLPLALRGYAERGMFAAWLRAVTVRTALAARRRASRRREAPLDLAARDAHAPSADPFARLTLVDTLARVPAAMRAVLVLRLIAGYSHAEIGDLLGIRAGTSEVRLFRALRQLRALLQENP